MIVPSLCHSHQIYWDHCCVSCIRATRYTSQRVHTATLMDTLSPHPPSCIGYRDYTEEIITYAHFSFLYGSEVRTMLQFAFIVCVFLSFGQETQDQSKAGETRRTVTQWYSTIRAVSTWPEQHASSTLHWSPSVSSAASQCWNPNRGGSERLASPPCLHPAPPDAHTAPSASHTQLFTKKKRGIYNTAKA